MEKITSRQNPTLVHIKKLLANKSYRQEHKEFVCEGEKLLIEAFKAGAKVKIILSEKELGKEIITGAKVIILEKGLLKSISAFKNPHDLLFICEIPKRSSLDLSKGTYILLDNVQDPGNIGTIIRTADALSVDGVLLFGDCADIYNPKVIRATMGGVFCQNIAQINIEELKAQKHLRIIGTTAESKSKLITEANLKNSIIILGNEGKGISPELFKLCSDTITIPISNRAESLNVAAAASIIIWEATKAKS